MISHQLSDTDRQLFDQPVIWEMRSTDKAGNEVQALSVDPRVGISGSASEIDDIFYFSYDQRHMVHGHYH